MNCSDMNIELVDYDHSGSFEISKDALNVNEQHVTGSQLVNLLSAVGIQTDTLQPMSLDEFDDLLSQKLETFVEQKLSEDLGSKTDISSAFGTLPQVVLGNTNSPEVIKPLELFLQKHPLVFLAEEQTHSESGPGRCQEGCTVFDSLTSGALHYAVLMPENTGNVVLTSPTGYLQLAWSTALSWPSTLTQMVKGIINDAPLFGYEKKELCLEDKSKPIEFYQHNLPEDVPYWATWPLPSILKASENGWSDVDGLQPSECK